MFKDTQAFSGFSTDDIKAAQEFYGETLGLKVTAENGMLTLHLATGGSVLVYPKDDHEPAEFTVLNFPVDDIDVAVAKLKVANVPFESYEGDMSTDDHNIARGIERNMGPDIAWFRDPAGNILAVMQLPTS